MGDTLTERVNQIEKTLYFGNGTGAVVSRLQGCETELENTNKRLDRNEASMHRWEGIATKLAIGLLVALLSMIGRTVWEAVVPRQVIINGQKNASEFNSQGISSDRPQDSALPPSYQQR